MNRFFVFTFTHHCSVYMDSDDTFDLISCSTLLSIYLSIIDYILEFIKYILGNIKYLIIFQLVTSSIMIIAIIIGIIIFLFCCGFFCITLFYILSFIPLGGWWFCDLYSKCNHNSKCEENSICKKCNTKCDFHRTLYKIKFIKNKLQKHTKK